MIKVCHIVNLITGKTDGVYTHLKMIFENTDRNRFEHILIFQGGEKIEREVKQLGVKLYTSGSLKKKISLKAFIDIYKILKEYNIDIIHTHLIKPYAIAGLINIFLKKKFIFNYHGIFLANNPYYSYIGRLIYIAIHYLIYLFGKVDSVLVPSERSKIILINETKLFPEPIVYYNGYQTHSAILAQPSIEEKIKKLKELRKIIAMVARLEVQKRIDKALALFKSIIDKRDDVYLLIFGDGVLKQKLMERTKNLGIESNVFIFDFVANIASYYSYFDLLLFTSDWEGMPLSMWEAMANKVPVVAPDVGGFKEILENNNCGFIYKPGNMKDAEEKILKLLSNEQLRKTLGECGKAAIEMKYNENNFINEIEQIYFNLVSK